MTRCDKLGCIACYKYTLSIYYNTVLYGTLYSLLLSPPTLVDACTVYIRVQYSTYSAHDTIEPVGRVRRLSPSVETRTFMSTENAIATTTHFLALVCRCC